MFSVNLSVRSISNGFLVVSGPSRLDPLGQRYGETFCATIDEVHAVLRELLGVELSDERALLDQQIAKGPTTWRGDTFTETDTKERNDEFVRSEPTIGTEAFRKLPEEQAVEQEERAHNGGFTIAEERAQAGDDGA